MSFFQINIMFFKRTLQQHYVLGVRFYIPMEYENKTEEFGKKAENSGRPKWQVRNSGYV